MDLEKQEQEYNEAEHEDKTAWYELVTHRYFYKNIKYIEGLIQRIEKDVDKLSDSTGFDKMVEVQALLKTKNTLKKLLTHYHHVHEEKLQADYRLSEKAGKSENIPANQEKEKGE